MVETVSRVSAQNMNDILELTTHCIRCGFCLESCPTFVTTANEIESPRGRIYLVRSAVEGLLDWQKDVRPHIELCLGCRACETACPSGVEYGRILEGAKEKLEQDRPQFSKLALLNATTRPSTLKAQLAMGKLLPGKRIPTPISMLLSKQKPEVDQPTPQKLSPLPPLIHSQLKPVQGQVYLLEGCAMRVLFPRVHEATRRLLRRIGYEVLETAQGCCGAMHAHNGYIDTTKSVGRELLIAMSREIPVIVNSAGCGSTMKDYGNILEDTAGATKFAKRTFDASEFLFANGLMEELASASGLPVTATYHDACHLAHGQKITSQPRELIQAIPRLTYVPLQEADMCCGSAGVYNVLQPKMARSLVERKYANIEETGARIVATGNPGCHAWIAQAAQEHGKKISVLHTMELLEAAFCGLEPFMN
ncbi:MAG: (Fe-S)-binding protein [Fimbriimonas sp.]|nr:(Fe-S)-binding protein [Fimbriimonas sp.]